MATIHTLTLRLSAAAARSAGTPTALAVAMMAAVGSVVYGASVGFSEEWALVFDIVTAVVPLLMVFVLQSSQNRDGLALQAKLDELILRSDGANRLVGAENMDEHVLRDLADTIQREAAEDCAESIIESSGGRAAAGIG